MPVFPTYMSYEVVRPVRTSLWNM